MNPTLLTDLTDWLWILGLLGLGVTFVIWSQLRALPPGNEVMRGLAARSSPARWRSPGAWRS